MLNFRERIISITPDNATSNDSVVRDLHLKILNQDYLLHQTCVTHIIKPIVKAGFMHFDECREAIAWINSSTQRVDELKRCFLFNGLDEMTFHTDNRIR